jgi:hypothetical protein
MENLLYALINLISKISDSFKSEIATLTSLSSKDEAKILEQSTQALVSYRHKLQNLKAKFETDLQSKFIKSQQSSSNAIKFERELRKQLAMKLSREQKLSLAVYQERYIQEYIKERLQVLKANNETLSQVMVGHDCLSTLDVDLDNQKSLSKVCKEITISCSFLPRLKARTDNFQTHLVNISNDVYGNLREIGSLATQELELLGVVNYSSQNIQNEINKKVYSDNRFTLNPAPNSKNSKIALTTQDPMFLLLKFGNKIMGKVGADPITFLTNLFNMIKQTMFLENAAKIDSNIDYLERKLGDNKFDLELGELNQLLQGYETGFMKQLNQKLTDVDNKVSSFRLENNVQVNIQFTLIIT